MHIYLEFENARIRGEGTDYVGPWQLSGSFDPQAAKCEWTKLYLGKHQVRYEGELTANGIIGNWRISGWVNGTFHIWPATRGDIQAAYLEQDSRKTPLL